MISNAGAASAFRAAVRAGNAPHRVISNAPAAPPPPPQAAPPPQASPPQAQQPRYGFVRDGRNMPDPNAMRQAGITPLLNASDPYFNQAAAQLRSAGVGFGVWDAPYGRDPGAWAQQLSSIARNSGANAVVLDVETEGKGTPGTPQWGFSDQVAQQMRSAMPGMNMVVAPMGMQDDFNYGAYTSRGFKVMPQAYGATYDTKFDPRQIVQRVEADGVNPNQIIGPILAPGQDPAGLQNFGLYALDDFQGRFPTAPGTPAVAGSLPGGPISGSDVPPPSSPPINPSIPGIGRGVTPAAIDAIRAAIAAYAPQRVDEGMSPTARGFGGQTATSFDQPPDILPRMPAPPHDTVGQMPNHRLLSNFPIARMMHPSVFRPPVVPPMGDPFPPGVVSLLLRQRLGL